MPDGVSRVESTLLLIEPKSGHLKTKNSQLFGFTRPEFVNFVLDINTLDFYQRSPGAPSASDALSAMTLRPHLLETRSNPAAGKDDPADDKNKSSTKNMAVEEGTKSQEKIDQSPDAKLRLLVKYATMHVDGSSRLSPTAKAFADAGVPFRLTICPDVDCVTPARQTFLASVIIRELAIARPNGVGSSCWLRFEGDKQMVIVPSRIGF